MQINLTRFFSWHSKLESGYITPRDTVVTIAKKELLYGTLCKKTLGSSMGSLIHLIWVDLYHQLDNEDEESNIQESLLEKTFNEWSSSNTDYHRRYLPLRMLHIRSQQRLVILVHQ